MNKPIIRQVWENVGSKQLLITIPKNEDIKKGDYIRIQKIE